MTARVVVFDLGNVLVRWDRRFLYEQVIADPVELDWFLDNVLTLEENAVLDRGTSLHEMTADLARRHPDHAELVLVFRDRWIETMGGVIDGSLQLLRALVARGVPCFALSNWGRDTFALVESGFDWLELFDGVVISGREGVTKPDPAIFELLCERHGIDPAEALFIDDSPANIDTAAALGFATHQFVDPGSLQQELEARALL